MKKTLVSLTLTLAATSSLAHAQLVREISTSPKLSVQTSIGYVPRENAANPAEQGATWAAAAANWMDVLHSGITTKGTGYEEVTKQPGVNYRRMVTSSGFRSWDASLSLDPQFGGRNAVSLWPSSKKAGVTFKPRDITMTLRSYVYSPTMGWKVDVVNATANFTSANYFRHRLQAGANGVNGDADDVMAGVQDLALPTTSFLYGGLMAGTGAFGSGDNAQKLLNVVNYHESNHTVLFLTVSIPFDDNGVPEVMQTSTVFLPVGFQSAPVDADEPSPPLELQVSTGLALFGALGNMPATNGLYVAEESTDLQNWSSASYPDFGKGVTVGYPVDFSKPRSYFRVRSLIPFTPSAGAAAHATPRSAGRKPVDDSVAP